MNTDYNCSMDRDETLVSYIQDIEKYPELSGKEEKELVQKAKGGDKKAFNKLVNCNLRYVVRYVQKTYPDRQDKMDLIQAGSVGLVEAAKILNFSEKWPFRFYSLRFIERACLHYLAEMEYSVKIRLSTYEKIKSMEKETYDKPLTEKETLVINMCSPVSFEEIADNEEWIEQFCSYEFEPQYEASDSFYREKCSAVCAALETLTEREKIVLRMHYGLGGSQEMTFRAIGKELGFSADRAGQIEHKALRKLRHPSRTKFLREVFE